MEIKEREAIPLFSKKEADEQCEELEREGYGTKIVKLKDGRYIVYIVGEKWECQR